MEEEFEAKLNITEIDDSPPYLEPDMPIEEENPIINLNPPGSIISRSMITNINYHVIKFYTQIKKEGEGWIVIGQEATEKHPLGGCKYCSVEE